MAQRLGIAPASTRMYVRRGILRAEKIGRDWLVTESELAAYGETGEGPRTTPQGRAAQAHRPGYD